MNLRTSTLAVAFPTVCLVFASCSGEEGSNGSSMTGSGGAANTGGMGTAGRATGGTTSTGGITSTGGMMNTGGTTSTGGTMSTGGTVSTGGTTNTGGTTSTGGTVSTGGTTSTGGATNTSGTGGASGSGGASNAGTAGTGGGKSQFHIYLALGQSNMQGAAHLPDPLLSLPRVMVLQGQNCSQHDSPYGQWREYFAPMIRCPEGTRAKPDGSMGPIGLGPADSFAMTMAEAAGPNVTIGIAGAAYGGTDIQAHLPNCGSMCKPPYGDVSGAPVVNGTTPIYQWILDLGKKAQAMGEIKGIIFHHGENNSGQQAWLTHVQTYITSLRKDLGLDPAKVPFIAGELPRTGCCPAHNSIVQQIPEYVENGHWVSSGPMPDGTVLGDRGDSLHWSTFSVIEMGKRYAAKMLEVGDY
jgi:hypothetical protein